jgi:hypothetical protein
LTVLFGIFVINLCYIIREISLFHIIREISLFPEVYYPAPATTKINILVVADSYDDLNKLKYRMNSTGTPIDEGSVSSVQSTDKPIVYLIGTSNIQGIDQNLHQ